MITPHAALTAAEVVALGGWHPRYVRVIAVASAGGYGFALVDGNGDGSELEAEHWLWHQGSRPRAKASMSARRTANRFSERMRHHVVNWRRPRGLFPILELRVRVGEPDEVNALRRADLGCVRVSLHLRVA